MKEELVTVAIPSYNHAQYIECAIDSVVNQTYGFIKLVVIDDGSQDGSGDFLHELQKKYDFTLVTQKNMGISKTLNRALFEFSEGDYFIVLASDDIMAHDRVEKQVAYFKANPEVLVCHADMEEMATDGRITAERVAVEPNPQDLFINLYKGLTCINAPTVAFQLDRFKQFGGYVEGFRFEDLPTWLNLSKKAAFGYLPEKLTLYRRHDHNTSVNALVDAVEVAKILEAFKGCDPSCEKVFQERCLKWFKKMTKHNFSDAEFFMRKCSVSFFNTTYVKTVIQFYLKKLKGRLIK